MKNRLLLGLGSVLSLVLLVLPLAQLACSKGVALLGDEFGNSLASSDGSTIGTATYALGASLDFYAGMHDLTTPDTSILDLTADPSGAVHAVALAEGTATLNFGDVSTTVDVARVDSVAPPTGASLMRDALARLPLHYAAGMHEVFARNQIMVSTSTTGATAAGHTPGAGLDEAWVMSSSGDSVDLTVTVAASPTDVDSFDLTVPVVDESAVATVSLTPVDGGVEAAAWQADGTQVFGAQFQWTLGSAALMSPLDSPGDRYSYIPDAYGDNPQELCVTVGSANTCMTISPVADGTIE